jgi:nicotinate-nucleotide pyrophosphorylase (carboxylating)
VKLDAAQVARIVRAALDEDMGARDATTDATVLAEQHATGVFLAKQDLVVAGLDVAAAAFRALDPGCDFRAAVCDGARVRAGTSLATAERVALNFLQRLCGVATVTRRFTDAVAGTRAQIRDTRKTTPLLRALEKYAVVMGGAVAHRPRLDSAILVKDNHVRLAGSVGEATRRAVAAAAGLEVEVEVDRPEQIEEAIAAGAQMVLVDNFTPDQVRAAVLQIAGRVPVEASGGIRLENVRAFAEAGPDFIAIGALTHSAPAVDISLEIEPA